MIPSATIPRTTPTIVPVFEPLSAGKAVGVEDSEGTVLPAEDVSEAGEVCDDGLGVDEDEGPLEDDVVRQEMSPFGMKRTSKMPDWNTAFNDGREALNR